MSNARARKRVFSGIQPSGVSHIGNYLGAIRNWVTQQETYDNIFCVVNLHAITLPTEREMLRENTLTMANTLLAAGLTYLGDMLGVDLYLAAVVVFGVRIFENLAKIRRLILGRFWSF